MMRCLISLFALLTAVAQVHAEKPKAVNAHPAPVDPLIAKAEEMQKAGKLMDDVDFLKQRKAPEAGTVKLETPSTKELSGREVAKVARAGYMRVGWFFHCTKCGNWHSKLAGGYAIASDAIATAWHVMTPPPNFKEGYAIAVDVEENVVPITSVIAGDEKMDAIVMRTGKGAFLPLAMSDAPEVGDTVYLFSEPLGQRNYFSSGMVNRFHMVNDNGSSPVAKASPSMVRMNVSTDWAPGSSGAAVVDAMGNVVGHVATMVPLFERQPTAPKDGEHGTDRFNGASLITLHDAIPAKSVLSLIKKGNAK